mmetsp:Transcript_145947/g.254655  ORF Transcript_145947/g.254655 Transcript_145947/m.254655 type:complete len:158 (-) Transcript_145947:122-595(-)
MGNQPTCQTDCQNKCKFIGTDASGDEIEEKAQTEVVDMSGFEAGSRSLEESKDTGNATPKTPRQRRVPFQVELSRTGKHWRTLGLLVSPDDDPRYLIVDDIWEPSLISEWNGANPEEKRVRAGDIITAVNNSTCSGEEMLSKIQALGKGASITLSVE